MKILYFHQYFSTPMGTTGTRSFEFSKSLIARGHEVTMVCIAFGEDLPLSGSSSSFIRTGIIDEINVIQLNLSYNNHQGFLKRSLIFSAYAIYSVYLALSLDYDLAFATSTPLTAGIPGIFAKFLRQKPFVFEVRDLWPELPRAMGVVKNPLILALMGLLERLTYRAASACIGLSPGIREGIITRSPKGKAVAMIPNGADLEIFFPDSRDKLALQGISSGDCVAVFTGTHGIANGLHAVLDAARVLLDQGRKDVKIIFIGDGKLKPELQKRAIKDCLENCIFLDPLPKLELQKIVTRADVGLMILDNVPAFYYGTSPNKFFDYISSGLPILNNYPGWLAEMIGEYNIGKVVPPEEPEAFADALCFLADNPTIREQMGIQARKLAEEKFDRKKLATMFVDFLEQTKAAYCVGWPHGK